MPHCWPRYRQSLESQRVAELPQLVRLKGENATLEAREVQSPAFRLQGYDGSKLKLYSQPKPLIDTPKTPLYHRNTCQLSKLPLVMNQSNGSF